MHQIQNFPRLSPHPDMGVFGAPLDLPPFVRGLNCPCPRTSPTFGARASRTQHTHILYTLISKKDHSAIRGIRSVTHNISLSIVCPRPSLKVIVCNSLSGTTLNRSYRPTIQITNRCLDHIVYLQWCANAVYLIKKWIYETLKHLGNLKWRDVIIMTNSLSRLSTDFIDFVRKLGFYILSNALHSSIGQNIKSLPCPLRRYPLSDVRSPVSVLRSPARVWKTSNGHNSERVIRYILRVWF